MTTPTTNLACDPRDLDEVLSKLEQRVRQLIEAADGTVKLRALRGVIEQDSEADDLWSALLTLIDRGEIGLDPSSYEVTLRT